MDIVYIKGLKADAIIGIFDWERKNKQRLVIDLEMDWDFTKAGKSDAIDDALDYAGVSEAVIEYVENTDFQLLETLVEKIAILVIEKFGVEKVGINLDKGAVVDHVDHVGVKIVRDKSWFLGLEGGFN